MKQKRIAVNASIFNTKSALSTSLLLNSKSFLILTVPTTSPNFLLVNKLNDKNDKNIKTKDIQTWKQEEEALEFAAYILVLRT